MDQAASTGVFTMAFRFDPAGNAIPVPPDEQDAIDLCHEGFVWVHLDLVDERARDWIEQRAPLPPTVRTMLVRRGERSQLHTDGPLIWGIVPDFIRDIGRTADAVADLRFAVSDRFVISARHKPLQAIETTRDSVAGGRRVDSSMLLFEAIMARVAEAFEDRIGELSEHLSHQEDRVIVQSRPRRYPSLAPMRRETVRLVRQLHALRAVFHRLDFAETEPEDSRIRRVAARLYQRMDALWHDALALQDRARLLQDEIGAKLTAETNRQLYILTILATILMPPTFITGVFGMNVKGLPFGENANGFLYAIGICLASLALTWLLMLVINRLTKSALGDGNIVPRAPRK